MGTSSRPTARVATAGRYSISACWWPPASATDGCRSKCGVRSAVRSGSYRCGLPPPPAGRADGWIRLRRAPATRLLLRHRQQPPEEPEPGLWVVANLFEGGQHGRAQGIKEHFVEIDSLTRLRRPGEAHSWRERKETGTVASRNGRHGPEHGRSYLRFTSDRKVLDPRVAVRGHDDLRRRAALKRYRKCVI